MNASTEFEVSCAHCRTGTSPTWRKGLHDEDLCNSCELHLSHTGFLPPLSGLTARHSVKHKATNESTTELRRAPLRDSKRRLASWNEEDSNQPKKRSLGLRKSTKPKRTARLASVPLPCGVKPDINASLSTTKFCLMEGMTIYQNDIVMIQTAKERPMFVKVRDFKIDVNGDRFFLFTWMIPKERDRSGSEAYLSPNDLIEGPEHPDFVPIEHIMLVYYSPASIQAPLRELPAT